MKKIQDIAGFVFVSSVAVLSVVSILGIWEVFERDVITKSFETLGLLAVVAVIIIAAGKFVEHKPEDGLVEVAPVPNPLFRSIRRITVGVLITSAVFLAFLGVLSIWDVIADKQVLYKSFGSLAVLAFGSFVVMMTSLEREGNRFMNRTGKGMSVGMIIFMVVAAFIFLNFFRFFF